MGIRTRLRIRRTTPEHIERRWEHIGRLTGLGTAELDLRTNVFTLSPQFSAIHGGPATIVTRTWDEAFPGVQDEDRSLLVDSFSHDDTFSLDYRFHLTDGEVRIVSIKGGTVPGEGRHPGWRIATARDVTDERALYRELRRLASHDPLTDLLNRRDFEFALNAHVSFARHQLATPPPGSLMLIDLDNFKRYNDTFGHDAGDALLKSIASGLSRKVRANDVLARIGGDEFALLLPEVTSAQAARIAQTLVDVVRETSHSVTPDAGEAMVTATIGFTDFTDRPDEATVFRRADRALYAAKAQGRDTWHRILPGDVVND